MYTGEDEDEVIEAELPAVYTADAFTEAIDELGKRATVCGSPLTLLPGFNNAQAPQYAAEAIPDVVVSFLRHFQQAIADRSAWELHALYENSFNKLTEKFYAKAPWPMVDQVAAIVGEEDQVFIILYKELYYRHIYSKLQPTLDDRIDSYENYRDLFNYILKGRVDEREGSGMNWTKVGRDEGDMWSLLYLELTTDMNMEDTSIDPTDLELPNQWLWDIIDEFIYQFQAFCQFRSKINNKSEKEVERMKNRPDVWNVLNVLNVLYSLIQKSRINEQLWVSRNGGDMMEAAGEFGSRPLYRMLGYFSIVGLLRVHCLLGDYTMALKTMENIELTKKGLFARVTACHVTTYYYVGFAYIMMRRYSDAIKAFAHILLFVSRTKQYHTRSYQYEVISKKCEQMYALLSISVSLSPQRIDENVHALMREKYGEQLIKLQKDGEESLTVYEELFLFACPKFISPAPPRYDEAVNQSQAPTQLQLRVFLDEVRQQLLVPTIRSYLKLYTTLRIDKLATFIDKSPDEIRTELLVFKHKTQQRRWESGSVLDGEISSTSDLDFYIKEDMIHISESKVGRRIGDWFIRNIEKFDDQIASMSRK
ncbi:Eukaryotic translation initiation factor 3 subunit L [Irineochytrium annulatum]|nr:Eukaryotic translation initiation factor 3 subunit L [Irineochytrium annulatum]